MLTIYTLKPRKHSIFDVHPLFSNEDHVLLKRAIIGVLRNAQEGNLPLFTWTLGMPQSALMFMLKQSFPELDHLEAMDLSQYNLIKNTTPADFFKLNAWIYGHRSVNESKVHADWLARAVAAASFGSRSLWEEMELVDSEMLGLLIEQYFAPLFQQKPAKMPWKVFFTNQLKMASAH